MKARAPGKIVISGAYSVLEGAPALVAAVDRYALADSDRPPPMVTAEVQAAIDLGALDRAPFFDASALRAPLPGGGSRKLGLGSSAAILVASIAAASGDPLRDGAALARAVFPPALAAHRRAQPRGSGIDVAASAYGGVIEARLAADGALAVAPHALPAGLILEVYACPTSATTDDLVGRVKTLAHTDRHRYTRLLGRAGDGARAAAGTADLRAWLDAVELQIDALGELGAAAGAGIVTSEVGLLRRVALTEGAVFGPSGAGGGDIALYAGARASSAAFRAQAARLGFDLLDLHVGAPGVSLVAD
ncbi:MAG: hypothetical protein U0359_17175 [Byssovorax sp.]